MPAQNVEENKARGHAEGNAEYAFLGQPELGRGSGYGRAAMGDHIRRVGTGKGVQEKDQSHAGHGQAHDAPCGLQQDYDTHAGHNDILLGRDAGSQREFALENIQIAGAEGRYQSQDPVVERDAVLGAFLEHGKAQVGQEHGEREVQGPGCGVVEHPDAERVGDGGGDPDLEQRPDNRNQQEHGVGDAGGFAASRFLLQHFLYELGMTRSRSLGHEISFSKREA